MIDELISKLHATLKDKLSEEFSIIFDDKLEGLLFLISVHDLLSLLSYLQDNEICTFNNFLAITAVDYLKSKHKLEVIYMLLSLVNNIRCFVKISVSDKESVPTITNIFSAAQWYEREVYDMFGIEFAENKDLRPILTDYGFNDHPLLKDFPLNGKIEIRYDSTSSQIISEPTEMIQEHREFDLSNPWTGKSYLETADINGNKEEKDE